MRALAGVAIVVVVCAAALQGAGAGQPQDLQTFRTGIDVVHVDVSVLDRDRAVVASTQGRATYANYRQFQLQTDVAIE